MSKRQQEKKKKNREKIAKGRVVARRNQLRAQAKKEREAPAKPSFVKPVHPTFYDHDEIFKGFKREIIMDRLAHNLEILKAIEEEYATEKKTRDEVVDSLEGETLREKMDNLHAAAMAEIPSEEIAGLNEENEEK